MSEPPQIWWRGDRIRSHHRIGSKPHLFAQVCARQHAPGRARSRSPPPSSGERGAWSQLAECRRRPRVHPMQRDAAVVQFRFEFYPASSLRCGAVGTGHLDRSLWPQRGPSLGRSGPCLVGVVSRIVGTASMGGQDHPPLVKAAPVLAEPTPNLLAPHPHRNRPIYWLTPRCRLKQLGFGSTPSRCKSQSSRTRSNVPTVRLLLGRMMSSPGRAVPS